MLAKKISLFGWGMLLGLSLLVAGCSPSGPRAFTQGLKYLDRGDYASAAARFKIATTLMSTNAQAWNYYGVALQDDGQAQSAAQAYQRAIDLDRDLVEAHYNLGCLWLEQNQPDAARNEFTAYTLRRNNDPAGWLKLGSAQLRLGQTVYAERSFGAVLTLKPGDAQAYNGLGLAEVQRSQPREAVRYFATALRSDPNCADALLNLATVSHEYLHDNKTALANYHLYLNLTPRPADWDQVNALVNQLEQSSEAPARSTVATSPTPVPPPVVSSPAPSPKPAHTENQRSESESRPAQSHPPDRSAASSAPVYHKSQPAPAASTPAPSMQVVQVQSPPQIVASPRLAGNLPSRSTTPAAAPVSDQPPVEETVPPDDGQKHGFWHRLFGSSKKESQSDSAYDENGVTPLPSGNSGSSSADNPSATTQSAQPENLAPARAHAAPVSLNSFPRYHYLSPGRPAAGNHATGTPAGAAFIKAQLYEQDENWSGALQWYQQAAQDDPSWYVAQYNTAVLAHRLRMYSEALPAYEYALVLRPDSIDTRYNFALALKAAGYVPDAVNELEKVIAARPDDAHAHLALANIYAQTLHDPAQARRHYLRVLDLDPRSPQASDIRFWLAANPQ